MKPEMQNREAPALVILGAEGKGEMTNYRVREQTYIVDRLFDRARLVVGSGKKARKWRSAVNPEDKPEIGASPAAQPIEAPAGIDLHPKPQKAVRLSKTAGLAFIVVGLGLLAAFAYGGYRRQQREQVAAREAGLPSSVAPATTAGNEFIQAIPVKDPPAAQKTNPGQLQPPGTYTGAPPPSNQGR